MNKDGITLVIDKDGSVRQYEPCASIVFDTKEGFERAKEILKREMSQKETCKWECDKTVDFYYRCGCEAIWYQEEVPLEWKYCPHCGKEIEIV